MARGKFMKNGVAPTKTEDIKHRSHLPTLRALLVRVSLLKPESVEAQPKTWKERLSFVAENAKNDKDAPSFLFGHLRCYIVFDTDSDAFYSWLLLVSVAVVYNFIFVIGRSCFWEMANPMPAGWLGKYGLPNTAFTPLSSRLHL